MLMAPFDTFDSTFLYSLFGWFCRLCVVWVPVWIVIIGILKRLNSLFALIHCSCLIKSYRWSRTNKDPEDSSWSSSSQQSVGAAATCQDSLAQEPQHIPVQLITKRSRLRATQKGGRVEQGLTFTWNEASGGTNVLNLATYSFKSDS